MAPEKGSSTQQKKVDKVVEEYRDIFSSPTGVPLHYQVKHPIDLTPRASLAKRALHRSSGRNSFQVGLGFQPLCLIDVAIPHVTTQTKSTYVLSEADKATRFIEHV